MSNSVYLFYAKRTPFGSFGGSLSSIRPDDLLATLLKNFSQNCHFNLSEINDLIIGCANQAGEDNRNIARMSLILADFPFEVPATTVNRLCGSSLDAVSTGFAKIKSGMMDCVLVGGVESMSRAPYVLSKANTSYDRSQKMWDTSLGWRFPNPAMEKRIPLLGMGETAEEIYHQYKISRMDQDQFAFNSHQKALKAQSLGHFKDEIIPVEIKSKKTSQIILTDDGPRSDTSLEKLSTLKAVFKNDGTVTAGNSSTLNDGASLCGLCSEDFLKKHNLTALAKIHDTQVSGVHPNTMGLGPISSTQKLLKNNNLKISDFDLIEINEAFAIQALACAQGLGLDSEKINLQGGAIALGHPLGASGTRLLTTLSYQLKRNPNARLALATMCIGLGQGISVSIEKC